MPWILAGNLKGPKGDAGSGVTIQGTDTWTNISAIGTPTTGDMWILSADDPAAPDRPGGFVGGEQGDGLVWDGSAWTNVGPIRGPEGPTGAQGPQGYGWTSDTGAPSDVVGVDGDFYLNTTASEWWGPKAGGTWVGTGPNSLVGPAGADGADGADGSTWHKGSGPPLDGTGVDGDYYLDEVAAIIYGPKGTPTPGTWTGAAQIDITGPEGPQGARGSKWYSGAGAPGAIGGQAVDDYYLDTSNGDVYLFT